MLVCSLQVEQYHIDNLRYSYLARRYTLDLRMKVIREQDPALILFVTLELRRILGADLRRLTDPVLRNSRVVAIIGSPRRRQLDQTSALDRLTGSLRTL